MSRSTASRSVIRW